MDKHDLPRRSVLKGGAAAGVAGLTVTSLAGPAEAFSADASGSSPRGHDPGVVIPWQDQPADIPGPATDLLGHPLVWEDLDTWRTPNDAFFTVKHYGQPSPAVLERDRWRLTVDGLVEHPQSLGLEDLRGRHRRSVDFTLECAGNHGLPFLIGGVGTARWGGTSLAHVLRLARPKDRATEVVFWGVDRGEVTVRDNSGVTGGGLTGGTEQDAGGGLDLTVTEQFARSMPLEDALDGEKLLCDEMNGADLPADHGGPLRLIAPGWYGVANVKWLTRIELREGRYAGRFMARDYVTVREEEHDGETVWTFTTVGHARLKSAPAKVLRRGEQYAVMGAAWGGRVDRVEVRVDSGPWHRARLHRTRARGRSGSAWVFWTWEWGGPAPGAHTVTSRAVADDGEVQPAQTDASIVNRQTYWENNGQVTRQVVIP